MCPSKDTERRANPHRHSCGSRNPLRDDVLLRRWFGRLTTVNQWIPAFAGKTEGHVGAGFQPALVLVNRLLISKNPSANICFQRDFFAPATALPQQKGRLETCPYNSPPELFPSPHLVDRQDHLVEPSGALLIVAKYDPWLGHQFGLVRFLPQGH